MSESDWDLLGMVVALVVGTLAIVFNRQYADAIIEQNRKLFPKWTYPSRQVNRMIVLFVGAYFLLFGLARLLELVTGG